MVLVQFAYGGSNILMKIALEKGLDQLVFVVYRHLIAMLLLGPLAYIVERKKRPSLSFSVLMKIFVLSSLGTTIHLNVYYAGLAYTSPTVASALSNFIPSLTFIIAVLLGSCHSLRAIDLGADISIIIDDRYGITYLNSKDVAFLMSLARAERLEDLDRAATAVARLGRKCSDSGLNRFDLVYTDLKLGTIDIGKLEYGSKEMQKRIDKMERLILATSNLYTALESLTEMEISEIKLKQWKKNIVAMQGQKPKFFE
ncbi:hypothetical protein RJ639_026310 [Escallonia herrerae]|uniref:EamA domain-containing protein n=1 Tax=Escallonia herrerae TaxID=1293975 RepID=A0AA88S214_9ASTE|nr:hypothetical protein RJ639_026310 [Escallonia herrerae]